MQCSNKVFKGSENQHFLKFYMGPSFLVRTLGSYLHIKRVIYVLLGGHDRGFDMRFYLRIFGYLVFSHFDIHQNHCTYIFKTVAQNAVRTLGVI